MLILILEKRESGQTLIEVITALAAGAIVVAAIAIAVLSSLNNSQYSKNQALASQYAQQGMEFMRKERDSSWSTFNGYGSSTGITYCLEGGGSTLVVESTPPCPENIDSFFSREIFIQKSSLDCPIPTTPPSSTATYSTKVRVRVLWQDAKCASLTDLCNKSEITSCFSNINTIPTP